MVQRVCSCHQQENFITAFGFRVAVRHLQGSGAAKTNTP